MGPVMLDVAGYEVTAEEKDLLDHPLVGGVILFSRNYHDPQQLQELVRQLREFSRNQVLVATDHEGGRVQRFRQDFSRIPAMGAIYPRCGGDIEAAGDYAENFGWLMAAELLAADVDLSFAPVLDVCGVSDVIGDRSFHDQPEVIIQLACRFIKGMHSAGMKATGKHFPGHGSVKEDSHVAIPIDKRSEQAILNWDMRVFAEVHQQIGLDAVMPAHVIYPAVDDKPAGFSRRWIRDYLRKRLDFDGVVFSDDLSMAGAAQIGDFNTRARQALDAGCDMVLVCNDSAGAGQVLDGLPIDYVPSSRIATLVGKGQLRRASLLKSERYQQVQRQLDHFYAD